MKQEKERMRHSINQEHNAHRKKGYARQPKKDIEGKAMGRSVDGLGNECNRDE